MPVDQTINGIWMHHNILLNDNKSIPQLFLQNKFIPIHGRPCVHPGTKFKALIAYFIEINQQSDSFPLLTIIKRNKTKTHFSVFLLKIFFSHKEIRY